MAQRVAAYRWSDVTAIACRKASRNTLDDYATALCNMTLNFVWPRWDWRESLATLVPFYLTPNTQDYGAPCVVIPSDFYGLRWANLVRLDNVPPYQEPLVIIKDLMPTHVRYFTHGIGYVPDRQCFRIYPRVPDNIGGPLYIIEGAYKKRVPLVTTNTIATTTLPFDDQYFQMWVEVMKYCLFQTEGDQRAGNITYANGGQITATGQAATALDFIDWVASMEGMELGEPTISPAEPLVSMGSRPPLFGLNGGGWY